jgi:hypothetical protein
MSDVEHWIGVCMAAGYDDQDFIELVDAVAGRAEIERVEIRSSEPDTPIDRAGTLEALLRRAYPVIANDALSDDIERALGMYPHIHDRRQ